MPQDFAKAINASTPRREVPSWIWFLTGLVCGLFLAFLIYLWKFIAPDPKTLAETPRPGIAKERPVEEMQWDFYEIFPRSEVPVVEEFVGSEKVTVEAPFAFLLQAGSFPDAASADRRRAKLILMGLEVFIREIEVKGQIWHRVLVGPLKTELELNRSQDLLAEAGIESLPFKVRAD